MAQSLASEILRVVRSPYAVSLINLNSTLKAAGPHEIRAWANSYPCQIKGIACVTIEALLYCPYALSVIEDIGIVAQIQHGILLQKPALLETLMRKALQDDMNFQKFSPALISLLSNPLPVELPPPGALVPFFMKCLERATKAPSISTIRPLYILVANGYKNLTLRMSESQKHNFTKRMAGFLTEKPNTDMNVFLTYCLTTLAHMHLALSSGSDNKSSAQESNKQKPFAIADIFQGKKAPTVLNLVINIVNHFASMETNNDGRESIRIIRMASVIVSAVSDSVKASDASAADAVNVKRLLEKAKTHEDSRIATAVLQFVSLLSSMLPRPPLEETIEELVRRSQFEGTADMFLPQIFVGYFATVTSGAPIANTMRFLVKDVSTYVKPTRCGYERIQERLDFIHSLDEMVPRSPNLRNAVLRALSKKEFETLLHDFLSRGPDAPRTCGEGEVCDWSYANLVSRFQQALCTFIIRVSIFSQGHQEHPLPTQVATSLMEKLTSPSTTCLGCPTKELDENTRYVPLPLFEQSASPEARISSRNWRHSLRESLARDADRQHRYLVSSLGDVCRDLELRCETVEKPLREQEQKCQKLQIEIDEWKTKYADVEEKLNRASYLQLAVEESEESLEREREEFRKKEMETKATHLEELMALKNTADQTAMDHMAVLNARQDMIDDLHAHASNLEQTIEDKGKEVDHLREKINCLEGDILNISKELAQAHDDLKKNASTLDWKNSEIERRGDTIHNISEQLRGHQERVDASETTIQDLNEQLWEHQERAEVSETTIKDLHEQLRGRQERAEASEATIQDLNEQLRRHQERAETSETTLKVLHEQLREHQERAEASEVTIQDLGEQLRGLQDRAQASETTIQDLHEQIRGHQGRVEASETTIQDLAEKLQQQKEQTTSMINARDELKVRIDKRKKETEKVMKDLEHKHENAFTELRSIHEAEISKLRIEHEDKVGQLVAKAGKLRKDWTVERDSLRVENKALAEKINKLRAMQEEKEKQAQNLGQQLLGLMSSTGTDAANLLNGNRNAASSGSLSDSPAIEPSPIGLPRRRSSVVPSRRKSDSVAENDHTLGKSTKRLKPNHTHSPEAAQTPLNFKSAKTPRKLSRILKGINQNLAGNRRPPNGGSDMAMKETPVEDAPSQESDYGTAFVITSTPKSDVGSQYAKGPVSRRKTMPIHRRQEANAGFDFSIEAENSFGEEDMTAVSRQWWDDETTID